MNPKEHWSKIERNMFDFNPVIILITSLYRGGNQSDGYNYNMRMFGINTVQLNNDLCQYLIVLKFFTTEYRNALGFFNNCQSNLAYRKKSSDGKTVYWYNSLSGEAQCNGNYPSGKEYYAVAFSG